MFGIVDKLGAEALLFETGVNVGFRAVSCSKVSSIVGCRPLVRQRRRVFGCSGVVKFDIVSNVGPGLACLSLSSILGFGMVMPESVDNFGLGLPCAKLSSIVGVGGCHIRGYLQYWVGVLVFETAASRFEFRGLSCSALSSILGRRSLGHIHRQLLVSGVVKSNTVVICLPGLYCLSLSPSLVSGLPWSNLQPMLGWCPLVRDCRPVVGFGCCHVRGCRRRALLCDVVVLLGFQALSCSKRCSSLGWSSLGSRCRQFWVSG